MFGKKKKWTGICSNHYGMTIPNPIPNPWWCCRKRLLPPRYAHRRYFCVLERVISLQDPAHGEELVPGGLLELLLRLPPLPDLAATGTGQQKHRTRTAYECRQCECVRGPGVICRGGRGAKGIMGGQRKRSRGGRPSGFCRRASTWAHIGSPLLLKGGKGKHTSLLSRGIVQNYPPPCTPHTKHDRRIA